LPEHTGRIPEAPPPTWWEKTAALENEQVEHRVQINVLKTWQARQNGALLELTREMKCLHEAVDGRVNKIGHWLIGLLGMSVLSLILLFLELAFTK